MRQIDLLAQSVSTQAQVLSKAWNENENDSLSSCGKTGTTIPKLDTAGEEARNGLIASLRNLEQLVLGPKDAMQSLYYRSAEAGVVQALCQLQVPQYVPVEGSISYPDLSAKVGVSEDRLKHLIRNAVVCSNYLAETGTGEVTHSPNSSIWQLDPTMANGMEVMLNHLPASSFKLGEVCTRDPTDEQEKIDGFSLARGAPLFEYLETNPGEGRRFAAHMRAQAAQSGDEAIQECYDWHSLKGMTIVDCGGSFGSVAAAIVRKEPGVRCIVQDLPKVINSAIAATAKNENFPHQSVSFQAQSFLEPQPVVADLYLFRMVFHNWCDQGARRIIKALQPALRPGARVVCIEYVMPPMGTAPIYAELATRRLDNVMYSLMKGKVRELEEFKALFHSVEPNLVFKMFRQGELKATHDPKCHSVLEWVYEPENARATTTNGSYTSPLTKFNGINGAVSVISSIGEAAAKQPADDGTEAALLRYGKTTVVVNLNRRRSEPVVVDCITESSATLCKDEKESNEVDSKESTPSGGNSDKKHATMIVKEITSDHDDGVKVSGPVITS